MLEGTDQIEPASFNHIAAPAAQSIQPSAEAAAPVAAAVAIKPTTPPSDRAPVRRRIQRRSFLRRAESSRGKKTLGAVLRTRRLELMMTQRDLASHLGVKPAHVAYLELDRRRPSLTLLSRITQVLDLDREKLILLSHPEARSFMGARAVRAKPAKDQGWREFRANKSLLIRHSVTKKELQVLAQIALLGRIESARSFLFILNSIRQAVEEE